MRPSGTALNVSRRLNGQEGFTVGEVVLGAVVLGVLTTLVFLGYTSFRDRARTVEGEFALNRIQRLQSEYFIQTGTYSDNLAILGFTASDRLQYYRIQIQLGTGTGGGKGKGLGANSFSYQASAITTMAGLDNWVFTRYPDGTTELRKGKAP